MSENFADVLFMKGLNATLSIQTFVKYFKTGKLMLGFHGEKTCEEQFFYFEKFDTFKLWVAMRLDAKTLRFAAFVNAEWR